MIRLLGDSGIVRNRRKIEASIVNARAFLDICENFGSFGNWLMYFFANGPIVNNRERLDTIPAKTPLSESIAKEMKVAGFRFFGPTIVYAHLQATGLINDHLVDCWTRK